MNKASIFLSIAFLASLLFVVLEIRLIAHARRNRLTKVVARQWHKIVRMVEQNPKQVVIEADKLLEFAMKIPNKKRSLGDALKKEGEVLFSDLNDVWRAHKLRNRIVHELGFEITSKDAKEALRAFKKALSELGVKFSTNSKVL